MDTTIRENFRRGITVAFVTVLTASFLFPLIERAEASLPGENGDLLITSREGPFESPPFFVPHVFGVGLGGWHHRFDLPGVAFRPAFSPSGARIAFVKNPRDQLWSGKVDRLPVAKQLTLDDFESHTSVDQPVFAPDSKSIIFSAYWGGAGPPESLRWTLARYWLKSGRIGRGRDITGGNPDPDISPNGKLIAFSDGGNDDSKVWLSRQISGKKWQFETSVPARKPSFSPNGKRIAFLGNVDGVNQVFIGRLDGKRETQLTSNDKQKVNVVFSPDGSKIAYQQEFDDARMFVRDLASGKEREVRFPHQGPLNGFAELNEWPRERLFRVLAYKRNKRLLRVRVYGPGVIKVRSGGKAAGKRKVGKAGTYSVRINRPNRKPPRSGRVIFRPQGALPGSLRFGQP